MSSGKLREVIYIKAKLDTGTSQYKKFAIDPNITNYHTLLGFLCKCFEIDCDFSITYLAIDEYGEHLYLPLKSDWDLDAAVYTCSDSTLRLKINLKPKSSKTQDWDIVVPADIHIPSRKLRSQPVCGNMRDLHNSKNFTLITQFSKGWERTLLSMRKAMGLKNENFPSEEFEASNKPVTSDFELHKYMDETGRIIYLEQFFQDVFLHGLDPSSRKLGWRILLSVYPPDTTGKERMQLMEGKTRQYVSKKEQWKQAYARGQLSEQQLANLASISIDVVRTDWKHGFYRGEENRDRVCQLFNILATYCIYHPNTGYSQGMSDLASPLLVVQNDEAVAYICFCALMQRLKTRFCDSQQLDLIANMQHLHDLLVYTDEELAQFFRIHNVANMYFTHRWFMLELKREFTFDDCLRIFEIQWASIWLLKNVLLPTAGIIAKADLESINNNSESYLVLTDCLLDFTNSPPKIGDVRHHSYSTRDVSLINSLIGSKYMIQLPEKIDADISHLQSNVIPTSSKSNLVDNFISETLKKTNILSPHYQSDDDSILTTSNSCSDNSHKTNTEIDPVHLKDFIVELPPPDQLGKGNPFLLFLCLSLILEYKQVLINEIKEPGDIIHFYQQRSENHNTSRVLDRARRLYNSYLDEQKSRLLYIAAQS